MKVAKIAAPIMFWVGIAILVVGLAAGISADIGVWSQSTTPLSGPFLGSFALLFGQVASPIWEGLALVGGSLIIRRMYESS
jgi:hypothetical protein